MNKFPHAGARPARGPLRRRVTADALLSFMSTTQVSRLWFPAAALLTATMNLRCSSEGNCAETATCPPIARDASSNEDSSRLDADESSDGEGKAEGGRDGAGSGSGGTGGSTGRGGTGGTGGVLDAGQGGAGGVKDAGGLADARDSRGTAGAGGTAGTGGGGAAGAGGAGAADAGTGGSGGAAGSSGGNGGNSGSTDGGGPTDAIAPPNDASDGCVLNACGGCGALIGEPNKPCGQCGTYVCTADKSSLVCENGDTNECGGCGALAAKPGASCGSCNAYGCDPGKNSVSCKDFTVKQLALGHYHSCVLLNTGGVRCWGNNSYGQLGDGSQVERLSPPTSDVISDVKAIAAGGLFTCALLNSGGARCWGWGPSGALGTGTIDDVFSPPSSDIANLAGGVRGLAAGGGHTCALLNVQSVRCWGGNESGQLGDGLYANRLLPPTSDIVNLPGGVAAVSAGTLHSCVILKSGGVRCWGESSNGALGIGDNTSVDLTTPPTADIQNLSIAEAIAAGRLHTCALLLGGGVRCWGNSSFGQLGDGQTTTTVLVPPTADVLSGVRAITAGWYHTCALLSSGALRCWGKALGAGSAANRSDTTFEVLTGVSAVAASMEHTCAVVGPGDVRCWGSNDYGQIGDGTKDVKTAPTMLPSFCPH
ncbi:MAG TPA: hypothetical protein VK550_04030 [Polyangiaceae bacterium]|nr:hypothetical protein [Polyangiaceae bacterium]